MKNMLFLIFSFCAPLQAKFTDGRSQVFMFGCQHEPMGEVSFRVASVAIKDVTQTDGGGGVYRSGIKNGIRLAAKFSHA